MSKQKENNTSKWLIGIGITLAVFALFSPFIFTRDCLFDSVNFSNTGPIGDTIGGLTAPFIGVASVICMYFAFRMQLDANKIMQSQFERNQFENQFFEMLKTHKENVNEIFVETIYYTYDSNIQRDLKHTQTLSGIRALEYIIEEINIAYHINKAMNENSFNPKKCLNEAYYFVWNGIENEKQSSILAKKTLLDYLIIFRTNISHHKKQATISEILYQYKFTGQLEISYLPQKSDFIPFNNHSSSLGHYYRHLFQTVKYVVSKEILTYEEKRNYLRILRAQMSNPEQVLLFYNWLAKYGEKWECEKNHFFTDYRMIHNVWQEMIIDDFDIEKIVTEKNPDYLKENNRQNDYLFEFQN